MAKAAAAGRLTQITAAVEALKEAKRLAEEGVNESKEAGELAELDRIEKEIEPLGLKLAFGEGAARLRKFKPSSRQAQQTGEDRLQWWENAESFLDVLLNDILTPIEGTLDRLQGGPLRGLITSTPAGFRIKPVNGAEWIAPPTAFTPASLAGMAERVLDRTADSDEYYRRRELLVCFAQHSGLRTYANLAGRELAREHPSFRARWARQPTGR